MLGGVQRQGLVKHEANPGARVSSSSGDVQTRRIREFLGDIFSPKAEKSKLESGSCLGVGHVVNRVRLRFRSLIPFNDMSLRQICISRGIKANVRWPCDTARPRRYFAEDRPVNELLTDREERLKSRGGLNRNEFRVRLRVASVLTRHLQARPANIC